MATALGDLSFYCSEGSHARDAPGHVDRLIEIYREDPDAVYQQGEEEEQDMGGVLETTAENLDFEKCDPPLAKKIRRSL